MEKNKQTKVCSQAKKQIKSCKGGILLHNRLKLLRKKINLTQKQFADLMGVTVQAYQKYEKGTQIPGSRKIIQLANKLKVVNLNWLLIGEGSIWRDEEPKKTCPRAEKILKIFEMLDENGKDDVLKYVQKIKQMKEMEFKIKELEKLIKTG